MAKKPISRKNIQTAEFKSQRTTAVLTATKCGMADHLETAPK